LSEGDVSYVKVRLFCWVGIQFVGVDGGGAGQTGRKSKEGGSNVSKDMWSSGNQICVKYQSRPKRRNWETWSLKKKKGPPWRREGGPFQKKGMILQQIIRVGR